MKPNLIGLAGLIPAIAAIAAAGCASGPAPGQRTPEPLPTATAVTTVHDLGSAAKKDPAGDLRNENGKVVTKPRYVDITKLEVETSGSDLLLTMTLAATPPAKRSSTIELIDFVFVLEATGDGEWDYWVNLANRENGAYAGSLDDWGAVTYHYDGSEFPGSVLLAENLVLGRVPLSMLGSPTSLAFCGLTQSSDAVSVDVAAEDNAPDGDCLGSGPMVQLK